MLALPIHPQIRRTRPVRALRDLWRWFKARGADATTRARFRPAGAAAGVRQSCCCGSCPDAYPIHEAGGYIRVDISGIEICTDCNTLGTPHVKFAGTSPYSDPNLKTFYQPGLSTPTKSLFRHSIAPFLTEYQGCLTSHGIVTVYLDVEMDPATDRILRVRIYGSGLEYIDSEGDPVNDVGAVLFDSGVGNWRLGTDIPNTNPACGSAALISGTGGSVNICGAYCGTNETLQVTLSGFSGVSCTISDPNQLCFLSVPNGCPNLIVVDGTGADLDMDGTYGVEWLGYNGTTTCTYRTTFEGSFGSFQTTGDFSSEQITKITILVTVLSATGKILRVRVTGSLEHQNPAASCCNTMSLFDRNIGGSGVDRGTDLTNSYSSCSLPIFSPGSGVVNTAGTANVL